MRPIYCGDDVSYTLVFKNSDGSPVDITGWKIYFTIKKDPLMTDVQASLKKDITEHDDPINGISSIHLSSSETRVLTPFLYYFDIQVKKTDDTILTILVDRLDVKADVTYRTD